MLQASAAFPLRVLTALLLVAGLAAADCVWTGNGPDAKWTTALNWQSGQRPTATDTVTFPASAVQGCVLNAPVTVRMLTLEAGFAYTVAGGGRALTIAQDLAVHGGALSGVGQLSVAGDLTLDGGSLSCTALTLAGDLVDSAGTLAVSGQATASADGSTWTFAAGSHLGDLDISQGALTVSDLVATGSVQVNGTTLEAVGSTFQAGSLFVDGGQVRIATGSADIGSLYLWDSWRAAASVVDSPAPLPPVHALRLESASTTIGFFNGTALTAAFAGPVLVSGGIYLYDCTVDVTASLDLRGNSSLSSYAYLGIAPGASLGVGGSFSIDDGTAAMAIGAGAVADLSAASLFSNRGSILVDGILRRSATGLGFTTVAGTPVAAITPGEAIYLTLLDESANLDGGAPDSVVVTVTTSGGDQEVVSLAETANASGIFTNAIPLPSAVAAAPAPWNQTLEFPAGADLQVDYLDAHDGFDHLTASLLGAPPEVVWTGWAWDGQWSTPGNWYPERVPNRFDTAVFDGMAQNDCFFTDDVAVRRLRLDPGFAYRLYGYQGDGSALLTVVESVLIADGILDCGQAEIDGDLVQTGGTFQVAGTLQHEDGPASTWSLLPAATIGQLLNRGEIDLAAIPAEGMTLLNQGIVTLHGGWLPTLQNSGVLTITQPAKAEQVVNSGSLTVVQELVATDSFSNTAAISLDDGALLDLSTCASVWNAGQVALAGSAVVRRFAAELAFGDGDGGTVTSVSTPSFVRPRLVDESANLDGSLAEHVLVILRSPATGDEEEVQLDEDVSYPGTFLGQIPTAAGSAVPGDGTLQMLPGENLVLSYVDPRDPDDRLTTILDDALGVEVALTSTAGQTTGLDPIPVAVHASQAIVGLAAADFVIGNGSPAGFTGAGQDYVLQVHPVGDGLVSVWLPPGVAASTDGSRSTRGATLVRTVDTQAPSVSIALAPGQAETTTVAPIVFAVSFNEPVTGFDAADVAIVGVGSSVSVSGSGASYLVSVSGFSGPGTVSIGIPAGAASDAAGNPSQAAGASPSAVLEVLSLVIGSQAVVYDGTMRSAAIAESIEPGTSVVIIYQLLSGDPDQGGEVVGEPSAEQPAGAGWYQVSVTLGGSQIGGGSGYLHIEPAPLLVTVNDQMRVQGAANPVFTGSVEGAIEGDGVVVVYTTSADAASPAGTYPITATVSALPGRLSNYAVIVDPGVLLVQAVGVTPVITSPATAAGVRGESFAYLITASGDPVSFAASGLPAGLSMDAATGAIGGIPTESGVFAATVMASNATGTGEQALSIAIAEPGVAPAITSPATAAGTRGLPFIYQITASGVPTAFAASGLPDGLLVDAVTGLVSGLPALSGSFAVTVTASNSQGSGSQAIDLAIAEPAGPAVRFLAARQSLFPGQAVQLTVATDAPVAADLPVLVQVTTAIPGFPAARLVTIPAGSAQATAALPAVPAGTAAGTAIACALSGVVAGSPSHLDAVVVGTAGDGEPLHMRSADDLADGGTVAGPQDINLQAVDGVPPYAVSVSGVAAVVRPWQAMAAAYDLDGDGDPDLGQQFTIIPKGAGTLVVTISDAASASATFTVTVQAGEPAPVTWSVPVSAPAATTYAAIGVSGFGGVDRLLQLTAGGDRTRSRGVIHSPAEGRWYELPELPAAGPLPWDGCYLASRLAVAGGTAARAMGSLPYIPLYPGWNFITVPPFLADAADPASLVTSVPVADLALFDESGAPLSRAARDALFAAAPIRTWDGSAFVTVTSVEAARGYFVANSSAAPVRMLYLAPVLGYGAATGGSAPLRAAARPAAASGKGQAALTGAGVTVATRPVGDPPAPPAASSAPTAAESGGGCGIGSLGLILGFGLVWLSGLAGLRRRR